MRTVHTWAHRVWDRMRDGFLVSLCYVRQGSEDQGMIGAHVLQCLLCKMIVGAAGLIVEWGRGSLVDGWLVDRSTKSLLLLRLCYY